MPPFHALKPVTISFPPFLLSHPPPRPQNPFSKPYTIHNHTTQRSYHTPLDTHHLSSTTLPPPRSPTIPFRPRPSRHRPLSTTPTYNTPPHAPPPQPPTPLSTDQYHRIADTYIDKLVAQLEAMQEEREDVDVEYSAGVLTLALPPNGTYVLNKQPPNKQIWLSSPISGPKRYDWVASQMGGGTEGEWVYLRDGSTLSELLGGEVGVEMEGGG